MATGVDAEPASHHDIAQPSGPSMCGDASTDDGNVAPPDSGPTATPPAAMVLDKLACLDVARKAERERRREESRAAADPRESVACFLKGFTARQRIIEEALQRMLLSQHDSQQQKAPGQQPAVGSATADTGPGSPPALEVSAATPDQVNASLELLSSETVALERSAAAASYYLPAYDQKQCAATVAALRAGVEGARAALAPRRRFAFGSKKVNKVRGEEVSAAAATATTTTTTTTPASTSAATCSASSSTSNTTAAPAAMGPGATGSSAAQGAAPTAPDSASSSSTALSHEETATPHAADTAGPTSTTAHGSATTTLAPTSGAPPAVPAASVDAAAAAGRPAAGDVLSWVSEQDRALVARGRGLMGLTDAAVVLRAEEVSEGGAGGDFVLLGLTRCRVVLLGRLRALRVAGLRGCSLVAGPVTGACFLDDVRDSRLSLATYQVRVHRTHATDLFLRVRSKPIIEHSAGVRVAPWAAGVAPEPRLDRLLQEHKLGEETGCWQQVEDFGWIKAVQSPNWCVMPPEHLPVEPWRAPEAVWEQRGAAAEAAAAAAGQQLGTGAADTIGATEEDVDEI